MFADERADQDLLDHRKRAKAQRDPEAVLLTAHPDVVREEQEEEHHPHLDHPARSAAT